MRRTWLSVPANIVEGDARTHPNERVQFLRIAWASLQEAAYYLHVARRLGYITQVAHDPTPYS
jgi:four helix bundle protein